MKLRQRLATCALFAFAVVSARPLVSQDLNLQHRWTKGETLRYLSTIESVMNMSGVPGMGEMTVTTAVTQVQQFAVEDIAADGTVTLRNVVDSIKMNVASPAGSVAFDSAAPPQPGSDPISAALKTMGMIVGEPVTLVVSRDGRVQKVIGASQLVEKLKKAMPEGAQGGMGGGPEGLVSEDAKRTEFEQLFSWLPNRTVKPGESWKHEMKVFTPMAAMTAASTYTFRGILPEGGRTLARIESTTTATPIPGTGSPMGPMTVQLGEGTGTAESFVDPTAARLEKVITRSTQSMNMSMTAPDGTAMSMQGMLKTNYTAQRVVK